MCERNNRFIYNALNAALFVEWRCFLMIFIDIRGSKSLCSLICTEESGEILNQSSEKLPTCAASKDINQELSEVPKPETLVSNLKPKYRSDYNLKLLAFRFPSISIYQTWHRSVLAMSILVTLGFGFYSLGRKNCFQLVRFCLLFCV